MCFGEGRVTSATGVQGWWETVGSVERASGRGTAKAKVWPSGGGASDFIVGPPAKPVCASTWTNMFVRCSNSGERALARGSGAEASGRRGGLRWGRREDNIHEPRKGCLDPEGQKPRDGGPGVLH